MLLQAFRFRLPTALAVALLFGSATAWAQGLNDGWNQLNGQHRAVFKMTIQPLFKGELTFDPKDSQHLKAVDLAARYAAYRVYLDHLEKTVPNKRDNIARAFSEVEGEIDGLKGKTQMQPLADLYGEKLREHALEVIQFGNAKPIHKIHNARILDKMAELNQPKLADTLLTVLNDKNQNDGVHYYALHGLQTLLNHTPPILKPDQEAKCAESIVQFLNGLPPAPKEATPEEIDGIRYLRRQALRALAQIHVPAINDKVRPALVLARFAGGDERLSPPPRIDERLEAAIGLARMQSSKSKGYQADYAASMIGKFLSAFGTAANNDPKGNSPKRKRPWRHDAYRMSQALAALQTDSGRDAFVKKVIDNGNRILQAVQKDSTADAGVLSWFLTGDGDSPRRELFKDAKDTTVKPAEASDK